MANRSRTRLIWIGAISLPLTLLFIPLALLVMWMWLHSPPPLPPLLEKATASGGWFGACPPEGDGRQKLAISPELDQRLQQQFSPGTPEQQLVAVLSDQGFRRAASCKNDPTIHRMEFEREQVRAAVYWKSDDAARTVWTKGFVFYISF